MVIAVFHEILHLKSYFALELNRNDASRKTPYRTGVVIIALQRYGYKGKYHEHFRGLNEAIIGEVEKIFFSKILELPEFEQYRRSLRDEEFIEKRKKISEKDNIPEDEIYWISEGGNNYKCFSYYRHREVLKYICEEIQKQFPEYHTSQDVYKEFLKSIFTGNILRVGRLIEKTFGRGSFRLIGNMTSDNQSAVLTLESLKKLRKK